jgi:hypothetical protein
MGLSNASASNRAIILAALAIVSAILSNFAWHDGILWSPRLAVWGIPLLPGVFFGTVLAQNPSKRSDLHENYPADVELTPPTGGPAWLSNRIFKSFDDIVDHCCYAWNTLIDQPWKIMSIARRDWAAAGHSI